MEIIPIAQFGNMQVYMRQRGKETNVLKSAETGWRRRPKRRLKKSRDSPPHHERQGKFET